MNTLFIVRSVADPDPGSSALFTPASEIRDGKKIWNWDPG
jgi:hypothetical protein